MKRQLNEYVIIYSFTISVQLGDRLIQIIITILSNTYKLNSPFDHIQLYYKYNITRLFSIYKYIYYETKSGFFIFVLILSIFQTIK